MYINYTLSSDASAQHMQLSGRRSRNKTKVGIQVKGSSAKEPNTEVGMVHVLCIQNICLQLCTGKTNWWKTSGTGRGIPFHDIRTCVNICHFPYTWIVQLLTCFAFVCLNCHGRYLTFFLSSLPHTPNTSCTLTPQTLIPLLLPLHVCIRHYTETPTCSCRKRQRVQLEHPQAEQ